MCPSCQVDTLVALVAVSFIMTLYMLFRRGIMGKGKTFWNVVVVFGLLLIFGVVARVMTGLAHSSHAMAGDAGSATFQTTTVDNREPGESQPAASDSTSSETAPASPTGVHPAAGSATQDDERTLSGTRTAVVTKKLPRVIDVGADKCIPCKKMAPILVELRKEYEGRVIVEFVDVWKDPRAGEPYNIRTIPTQVFCDADGNEVWRHEGFLPKADFVAKFAELGVK